MSGEGIDCGRRSFLKAAGATGSAAALGGVASASGDDPEELIVGVSGSAAIESVLPELPPNVSEIRHNRVLNYVLARVEDSGFLGRLLTEVRVRDIPGVEYVEPNVAFEAVPHGSDGEVDASIPDDPSFEDQYAPRQVNAPDAWRTTSGEGVTVAVVDTGIDYDHPDLASAFGDDPGRDFVDDDGNPYPGRASAEFHGSHVAGIAAGVSDNGTGIAGISDASLLSCRVLDQVGEGRLADVADGVEYAADQGADVINMSLGSEERSQTMENAISYALERGALPVAAAGNDDGGPVLYPAAYDDCVAVSAVDGDGNLAEFSNVGPEVDLTAPGVDVFSTLAGDEYGTLSGTSMACPVVSGVAALARSVGNRDPAEVRSILERTAVDVGLAPDEQGEGLVDAAGAVDMAVPGPTPAFSVDDPSPDPGDTVTFDASESVGIDGSIVAYEWEFPDGTASGEVVERAFPEAGEYEIRLTVTDVNHHTNTRSGTLAVGTDAGGCGGVTRSTAYTGDLSEAGDEATHAHEQSADDACGCTIDLSADEGVDFDLYVTLDGRTPTADDHDRSATESGDGSVDLAAADLEVGFELGILVRSYVGGGSYTLTVEERGRGDPINGRPTARIDVEGTVSVGETVTLSGADSEDPDGRIVSYRWDLDGTERRGESLDHAFGTTGDREVRLTVTDDAGVSHVATETVTVEPDEESCTESVRSHEEGSLSGGLFDWRETHRYTTELDDPCLVTVTLNGPSSADFDLYLLGGGTWTRSASPEGYEQLVVEVGPDTRFWTVVLHREGEGEYELTFEELGR